MKVYELVALIRAPLRLMNEKNIGASSVEYLDMFHEYRSMKREGLKTDYIVSRLCEKHKIGRTKFLDLVRCFEAEI